MRQAKKFLRNHREIDVFPKSRRLRTPYCPSRKRRVYSVLSTDHNIGVSVSQNTSPFWTFNSTLIPGCWVNPNAIDSQDE